jgi:hypothetical protein
MTASCPLVTQADFTVVRRRGRTFILPCGERAEMRHEFNIDSGDKSASIYSQGDTDARYSRE